MCRALALLFERMAHGRSKGCREAEQLVARVADDTQAARDPEGLELQKQVPVGEFGLKDRLSQPLSPCAPCVAPRCLC